MPLFQFHITGKQLLKIKKDQRKVDITSDDPSNLPIQIRNRQFSSPFSKNKRMESVSCDSVLSRR